MPTPYTRAFFDVGKEPWILSLPDMKGRYHLMTMLNGWTDVFKVPGTPTTGTGAQRYAVTGLRWTDTLPLLRRVEGDQRSVLSGEHALPFCALFLASLIRTSIYEFLASARAEVTRSV